MFGMGIEIVLQGKLCIVDSPSLPPAHFQNLVPSASFLPAKMLREMILPAGETCSFQILPEFVFICVCFGKEGGSPRTAEMGNSASFLSGQVLEL